MEYFWDHVRNETGFTRHWSNRLLFEKTVYLEDYDEDEFVSTLIVGIDIRQRLSIGARIEVRSACDVLHMDKNTLLELLDSVNDLLEENTVLPNYNRTKVRIQPINETMYKIRVGNSHVKLSMKALLTMRSKLPIIKMQIHLLERSNYEIQFYNLLSDFQYRNLHESDLLDRIVMPVSEEEVKDECVERTLLLEISTNFLEWFMNCIHLYAKSLSHIHIHNDTMDNALVG